MKKPVLRTLSSGNRDVDNFARDVKQTLDTMTGQQKNVPALPPLPPTATLADLIAAHNALLERVQGS